MFSFKCTFSERVFVSVILLSAVVDISEAHGGHEFFHTAAGHHHNGSNSSGMAILPTLKTFLVDLPCFLMCLAVTVVYALLWDMERLHGWIVIALTGSYTLRCAAHTGKHLLDCFAGHDYLPENAPPFCIAMGDTKF